MLISYLTAAILSLSGPTRPEILPGFGLLSCAWHATHVVVASEGERIDGRFEVLEVWAGDLRVKDRFDVGGMEKMAPVAKRELRIWALQSGPIEVIPCNRMVLFLRKKNGAFFSANRSWRHPGGRRKSDPEYSEADVTLSAAWVRRGQVFARRFGNQNMAALDLSETAFRRRVLEQRIERDAVLALCKIQPLAQRIARLEQFMASSSGCTRWEITRRLFGYGKPAAPVFGRILLDMSQANDHNTSAALLVRILGPAASVDFSAVLAQELKFWTKAAPSLKKGWRTESKPADPRRHKVLDRHHSRLRSVLYYLWACRGPIDRQAIAGIKKVWSDPKMQPDDRILESCQRLLDAKR